MAAAAKVPDRDLAPVREGLVSRLVTRLFFRPATVVANQSLAPGLRLIALEGPELQKANWSPGDKLQIRLGRQLMTRTYTPIHWDTVTGRTHLIAHTLAAGPGTEWVRLARVGDVCEVMGPRASLTLTDIEPVDRLLMGDETSVGLAACSALHHGVFEVDDASAVKAVFAEFGIRATVIARQPHDAHHHALVTAALEHARHNTRFLLTGRARTVQRLLRELKTLRIPANRIRTKAYWADGKCGLD